jgi:hypothetical protein
MENKLRLFLLSMFLAILSGCRKNGSTISFVDHLLRLKYNKSLD